MPYEVTVISPDAGPAAPVRADAGTIRDLAARAADTGCRLHIRPAARPAPEAPAVPADREDGR